MTASGWKHERSSHQRGYGTQWKKLRQQILDRDGHLCQQCAREGRLTGLVSGNPRHPRSANVDHIKRKEDGGTDEPENLEALCRTCHDAKTASERGGDYAPKGCDVNGRPLSPGDHWRR